MKFPLPPVSSITRRFPLLLGLFLLAVLPGAQAAPAIVYDDTIPNNLGVQLKADGDLPATLDQVRDLGLKWVRRGFNWESMEKEKGVYDFSRYDLFVKNCKARGLSIIGCMTFSNKLYGHPKDEPARTAYATWAAALAKHYAGEKIVWEIWNEPNTMTFWGKHGPKGNSEPYATEYTNLVKAVVPAMKNANPDCIILAGSVSNMWTESYKWMDFCFAQGMLKVPFDVWSVHPYGVKAPEDYVEAYGHMRKQMADAGGPADIPLMNSERGFPIGKAEGYAGGDASKAFEYQGWHLVRQYLIDQMLGVKATIWYEWAGKEGFALNRPSDPTPAFGACKVLIAQLGGYRFDKRIQTDEARDFVLRYVNPKTGGIKLVCWTAPPLQESPDKIVPHAIKVPVDALGKSTLATVQLLGEAGTLPVQGGSLEVSLTGAPQYLTIKP